MMVRDKDAPACGPPWSYPARYRDARGEEATTIFNDGRTLRMVVRSVEFSGPDFDGFEPPPRMEDAIGESFSLYDKSLTDCVLEWEMPIGMIIGDRDIEGRLTARLDRGPPRPEPNRGITRENLHLTLLMERRSCRVMRHSRVLLGRARGDPGPAPRRRLDADLFHMRLF